VPPNAIPAVCILIRVMTCLTIAGKKKNDKKKLERERETDWINLVGDLPDLTFLRCIALLYFAIPLESRKSANKRIYLSSSAIARLLSVGMFNVRTAYLLRNASTLARCRYAGCVLIDARIIS